MNVRRAVKKCLSLLLVLTLLFGVIPANAGQAYDDGYLAIVAEYDDDTTVNEYEPYVQYDAEEQENTQEEDATVESYEPDAQYDEEEDGTTAEAYEPEEDDSTAEAYEPEEDDATDEAYEPEEDATDEAYEPEEDDATDEAYEPEEDDATDEAYEPEDDDSTADAYEPEEPTYAEEDDTMDEAYEPVDSAYIEFAPFLIGDVVVYINPNGGLFENSSLPYMFRASEDETVANPSRATVRDGYLLAGWSVVQTDDLDDAIWWDFAQPLFTRANPSQMFTLYAVWVAQDDGNAQTQLIVFRLIDIYRPGWMPQDDVHVVQQGRSVVPTDPGSIPQVIVGQQGTSGGASFAGWYADAELTNRLQPVQFTDALPRLINVWARYQRTLELVIPTSNTPHRVNFPLDATGSVFVMPSFGFDDSLILRETEIYSVDGSESIVVLVPHRLVGWYTSPQPALQSTMPTDTARFDTITSRLRSGRVDGFGLRFNENGVARLYPWFEIDTAGMQRVTLVYNNLLTPAERTFYIPIGTEFSNLVAEAPSGTSFYRWDTQLSPGGPVSPWSGVVNTSTSRLVARFAFEVAFAPNGGSVNGSTSNFTVQVPVMFPSSLPLRAQVGLQSIMQNFTITYPAGAESFDGWYSVVHGHILSDHHLTQLITSNHVLYAAFYPIFSESGPPGTGGEPTPIPTAIISFNLNGGAPAMAHRMVAAGSVITDGIIYAPPTRTGYQFTGWHIAGTNQPVEFGVTQVFSDMTLVAQWVVTYRLYFRDGNRLLDAHFVIHGEYIPQVNVPHNNFALFTGWNVVNGAGTLLYIWDGMSAMPAHPLTLGGSMGLDPHNRPISFLAQWESNPAVTFHSGHGGRTDRRVSQRAFPTSNAFIPLQSIPSAPAVVGYEFLGWYVCLDSLTPFTQNTVISTDMNVYARWDRLDNLFVNVTFVIRGQEVYSREIPHNQATDISLFVPQYHNAGRPSEDSPFWYGVAGWYNNPGYIMPYVNLTNFVATQDVRLYGRVGLARMHRVHFYNADRTRRISYVDVLPGTVLTRNGHAPAVPSSNNYVFLNNWLLWDTGATWEFGWPINADTRLVAAVANTVTFFDNVPCTYDYEDGYMCECAPSWVDVSDLVAAPESTLVVRGESIPLVSAPPAREGYIFRGWYRNEGQGTRWTFEDGDTPCLVIAHVRLYAMWDAENIVDPGNPEPCGTCVFVDISSTTGAPGETVTVFVNLRNNPGINMGTLTFDFDMSVLTLLNAVAPPPAPFMPPTNVFMQGPNTISLMNMMPHMDELLVALEFRIANDAPSGDHSVSVNHGVGPFGQPLSSFQSMLIGLINIANFCPDCEASQHGTIAVS